MNQDLLHVKDHQPTPVPDWKREDTEDVIPKNRVRADYNPRRKWSESEVPLSFFGSLILTSIKMHHFTSYFSGGFASAADERTTICTINQLGFDREEVAPLSWTMPKQMEDTSIQATRSFYHRGRCTYSPDSRELETR